jgi:hypothetical protein
LTLPCVHQGERKARRRENTGCGKMPTLASSNDNNGQLRRREANKLVIAYHELNGNDPERSRNQHYHLLPLSNDTTIFSAPQ